MLSMKAAVAIVVLPSVLAGMAFAAQDRYTLQVPGGLAFSEFRGYEDWQTVAVSHNGDKLATILGNPAMIEAYKSGIPGNGKPFPDGVKFAKIHWMAKKNEAQPGEPLVPGALHDIDFMLRTASGSRTVADGDTPSSTTTPRPGRSSPPTKIARRRRSTTPSAASLATRSWPTRITSSLPIRSGEA